MADSDTGTQSSTLSALVSTLVPTLIIFGVYILLFLILRKSQRRYYAPRTYLGSLRESERTPALPTGLLNWVGAFWKIPDSYALQHQSLDAYLFLRFLKILVAICFVGCCILWPILFPINATGGNGQQQLDLLSYSNINSKESSGKNRFYAHVFASWIFYGFVLYMILRECIFYINLRQAFLLSPLYSNRLSSRTVLFTSVPEHYLDEARLRKVFGDGVKTVWITGDTEELDELVKDRDKAAFRLEKAEVKLLKLANGNRIKAMKKGGADAAAADAPLDSESGNMAARWVPEKKRPTHRLGLLGLIGKKVDTITWCREELARLIPQVEQAQEAYLAGSTKKIPAVFMEFYTQAQAESAFQVLAHHQALQMSPKYIGVTPHEVIWSSLKVSWYQRVLRRIGVVSFITALIIFWAIPVAVVGAISNVDTLKSYSWLSWLNAIPQVIMGVISGLLPAVLLSVLMSLVPIIMRLCARLSGEPSTSRVELFTQNAYFAFQLIQVFLVATLGSAATALIKSAIENPGSIISLMAQEIPKANHVYIPYFIVQGLTVAGGVLSQAVGFVVFTLMYKFLTGTPRAMYKKWASLSAISWGNTLPIYTNIAVICLVYAGIAPLIMGFAFLGLGLFYLAYRYNVLYVTDTAVDTRGLMYPRALKQLLAGVYVAEVCMIGLFAVSGQPGPIVLMVLFLIFTILFHRTFSSALDPLLYTLPRTLDAEEQTIRLATEIPSPSTNGEPSHKEEGGNVSEKAHSMPVNEGKKPGIFSKFFKPWLHCDYATMRQLVPQDAIDVDHLYTPELERNAYHPPSVTSQAPLLWIPEDPAGISKQEVRDTGRVIPITDEGCSLNEKNKLVWDTEAVRPPVWEEKIYY